MHPCATHATLCNPVQEEAFLKRYIEFCRQQCSPRISDSAAKLLANEYVELRAEVSERWYTGSLHILNYCLQVSSAAIQRVCRAAGGGGRQRLELWPGFCEG